MTFVTIAQIASLTGRHPESVRMALKRAGMLGARVPGIKGHRIPVAKANRFIARQWPGAPMFQEGVTA